jgi:transaldolase
MKLFIDSAQASQWPLPAGAPRIEGVTTNPSLVLQAGLPVSLAGYTQLIEQAHGADMQQLMVQVPSDDVQANTALVAALQPLAGDAGLHLTIKLPCDPRWQASLKAVQAMGLDTLLTGLSNPIQLMWAQDMGVQWVAPYVGRLEAAGRDVWALLSACVQVQHAGGPAVLAASVKSSDVLAKLMGLGAAAVTLKPEFIAQLTTDAVTSQAVDQFNLDTAASLRQ